MRTELCCLGKAPIYRLIRACIIISPGPRHLDCTTRNYLSLTLYPQPESPTACVQGPVWRHTLSPLLHVCRVQCGGAA